MKDFLDPAFENKIVTLDKLLKHLEVIKSQEKSIVFTNGCFDILHRGHVTYLAQAKSLGNVLIVGVNSDDSVKRLGKGDERPINRLAERMAVIASLADVDFVIDFDDDTPLALIKAIMPNVLVKGGDWSIQDIVGSSEILENGGAVYSIPFIYNTSTTQLINKINKNN